MITGFDRIVIAVPELAPAVAALGALLGSAPAPARPGRAWLALANTVIELAQCAVSRPRIRAVVLREEPSTAADPGRDTAVQNGLGLDIRRCDGRATAAWRGEPGAAPELAVDHIVLRSGDPQACIALFSGALGMRLALDQTVPDWGGRMLFFRCGKLTLEVIERGDAAGQGDDFWGIAYRVEDLDAFTDALDARGVAHSAVRPGRKPGTRVATVKSHCLDIPTLLIDHPDQTPAPDRAQV